MGASANDAYEAAKNIPKGGPMTIDTSQLPSAGNNIYQYNGKPTYIDKYGQVDPLKTQIANSGSIGSTGYQPSTYNYTQPTSSKNYTPVVRPSTTSTTKTVKPVVDEYGRVSTKAQGEQYKDAKGNLVTPKTGFSGLGGSGSSSGFSFNPTQGMTGSSGVMAGGSAFTGLLGGVGGLSTPATIGSSEDDSKKKQAGGISDIFKTALSGMANGHPMIAGLSGLLGAGGNLLSMFGDKTPQITTPYATLKVAPPSGTQDAAKLIETKAKNTQTLSNIPYATKDNDLGEMNAKIATGYQEAITRQDIENPIPDNPVVDTFEQMDFIQKSGDPDGMKAAIDQFRAEQTNLGNLTKDRLNVMKQVQALNETYSPILEDIKNNPNLPKGLAMRRLQEVNKSQKEVLAGFLGQLEILEMAINDQNKVVDRAFNIVSQEEDRQERAQDRARQALQMMVSSGGIGGFSDKDILAYSQATGIPTSALSKMRTEANSPDLQTSVQGSAETGYFSVSIDKKTGKVVSKTPISAGQAAAGAGSNQMISQVTGKPLSDTERTNLGYANRVANSHVVLDELGSKFTGLGSLIGANVPDVFKNQERQKFEQAERDFINANLRRESGAHISEDEFKNARKQYIPQPGNGPDVLAQKKRNREQVIKNLQLSGGQAPQTQSSGTSGKTSTGLGYTITN